MERDEETWFQTQDHPTNAQWWTMGRGPPGLRRAAATSGLWWGKLCRVLFTNTPNTVIPHNSKPTSTDQYLF